MPARNVDYSTVGSGLCPEGRKLWIAAEEPFWRHHTAKALKRREEAREEFGVADAHLQGHLVFCGECAQAKPKPRARIVRGNHVRPGYVHDSTREIEHLAATLGYVPTGPLLDCLTLLEGMVVRIERLKERV